jgi:hypothetical protein
MKIRQVAVAVVSMALLFLVSASAQVRPQSALAALKTTAERTEFRETSRYDDVMAFLKAVDQASDLVHLTSFGYSFEGRSLPLAVVGKVADARPETVRASGKLRVFIQANVHAGEVEGKESAQILLRDLAMGKYAQWMDSMVLLIAPIYNADGNEKVSLTNRGPQHGPIGGMGTRPNGQGLNINRDYMKLETPEARSMVKLLNDYDPHVMMDLHTTDGSRHAYHLTWEVPNNPAVDTNIAQFALKDWLAAVTRTVRTKYNWEFHSYGNVSGQSQPRVWATVEDLPRYSHNYWGIRNRFGILSETYSYLTFQDRIVTDTRFLEEVLNFANSNAAKIRKATEDADKLSLIGQRLSLRSKLKRSEQMIEILMGETEDEVNPFSGRVMFRRKDVRHPEMMYEDAAFESTDAERVPSAYYIPANLTAAIERLRAHGVKMERVEQPAALALEEFQIESTQVTPQAFENHKERTASGKYAPVEQTPPAGTYRIPMNQPLARLAFYLIEPRSNDGLLTWNVLDDALRDPKVYPILRTRN